MSRSKEPERIRSFKFFQPSQVSTRQSDFIQTLNCVTVIKCLTVVNSAECLLGKPQKFINSVEWKIELQVFRNKCTNGENP
jgi:hypothetical protein